MPIKIWTKKEMKKIRKNSANLPDYTVRNNHFNKQKRLFFCLIVLLLFLLAVGCESPSLKANKATANQTVENELPLFERDLQTMRTANFDFIYAFRRKDGAAFDSEDRKFLRATAPPQTNRFVSTDDGRAFIAGSGYKFSPETLEALGKRFNVEDYSTKKEETKEAAK